MNAHLLLVAKAPVAGQAKTRLGRSIGMRAAAELAAAALLDTIEVCADAFPGRCHLALAGSWALAQRGAEIEAALSDWHVFDQEGTTFGERLVHAHLGVGAGPVIQIGMDTPQVTRTHLGDAATAIERGSRTVIGPALDGGWWLLGLADPAPARALATVPMSQPNTAWLTAAALRRAGTQEPARIAPLRDVDTVGDAVAVARLAPHGRFGSTWAGLSRAAS